MMINTVAGATPLVSALERRLRARKLPLLLLLQRISATKAVVMMLEEMARDRLERAIVSSVMKWRL